MIDAEHRAKFIETWENGDYRRGSTALRLVDRLMSWIPAEATLNDYGCGTGRAGIRSCLNIGRLCAMKKAMKQRGGIFSFVEGDL